jgi:hypothetical protein
LARHLLFLFPSLRHVEAPCANSPSNRVTVASLRHGEEPRDDSVAVTKFIGAPDAIDKMLVCGSDDFDFRDVWLRWWKFVT